MPAIVPKPTALESGRDLGQNDPFDRETPVRLVVKPLLSSRDYTQCSHNLASLDAAGIIHHVWPRVVIPCLYDMMVSDIGSPTMFRVALERRGSDAEFELLPYYQPWLYRKPAKNMTLNASTGAEN